MAVDAVTAPCTRHKRGPLVSFRVIRNDQHTRWGVAEFRSCPKCGILDGRVPRHSVKRTVREALAAYGCTAEEAEAYMRTHFPEQLATAQPEQPASTSAAIAVALTSWPFPVSTHYPKPAAPAQPQSRRRQRAPIVIA